MFLISKHLPFAEFSELCCTLIFYSHCSHKMRNVDTVYKQEVRAKSSSQNHMQDLVAHGLELTHSRIMWDRHADERKEKHLHHENRGWWKRMTFSLWQLSNANRIPITFTGVKEGADKWLFVGRGKLYINIIRGQVIVKVKDFYSVLGLFQVIFPSFLLCISSATSCKKNQN